jgi:3-oxoadipate enol-lactonase
MKILLIFFTVIAMDLNAQNNQPTMEKSFIKTKLGDIAAFTRKVDNQNTPIIFLHGVYFDHNLWDNQIKEIQDRTVISIDMPWHGESKNNVPKSWDMNDCGKMLLEILDSLKIKKVIAIGHSWGSMTILQASNLNSERFASIGFCNMPIDKASIGKKISFTFQHTALLFRKFYTKQAAKFLFGKTSLKLNPTLYDLLSISMNKLTNKQVKRTDTFVILKSENTSTLLEKLNVPAIALKGKEDYVSTAPKIETTIVKGGHVSPLEAVEEVNIFCKKVISKVDQPSH